MSRLLHLHFHLRSKTKSNPSLILFFSTSNSNSNSPFSSVFDDEIRNKVTVFDELRVCLQEMDQSKQKDTNKASLQGISTLSQLSGSPTSTSNSNSNSPFSSVFDDLRNCLKQYQPQPSNPNPNPNTNLSSGRKAKPSSPFKELGLRTSIGGNKLQVIKAAARSDTEVISETKKGGGLRGKLNKVVLAYSGGLDTSVIVPWLRENYGCEVVCFTADVGQGVLELEGLEVKAKASGACQLVVKDLKEEFVKDYVFPCVRAGAVYERKYLLGTSMARPVIAKAMVDVAKEVGADAVSHGCTGKGNDQVRFELTFFALNPKLNVVAPWREWDITGREDAIEYAKKHNVPVPVTKKSIYSRDRNLWHLSHEGDILEDPANEPKKDMYMMSVDPEDAPDQAEYVEIEIESGLPVSVNGKRLSPAYLLAKLNEIGGRHGIGRIDMVENRLVGMKSRGVYETPGGTILFAAARELEFLTLDRETIQVKDSLALKYAELVYAGRWFDPLRESMDAFMQKITETTTGSVTLKLYKGSVTVTSRKSPFSLYRQDISSFESGQIYDQADAAGFIRLYGLPMRVRAMLEQGI